MRSTNRFQCCTKRTTYATLFAALDKAAGKLNIRPGKPKVTRIHVGYLDYGGTRSHAQGKACDIWYIYTKENGNNTENQNAYSRISKTNNWSQPVQPEIIRDFELALMDPVLNPESKCVWGPWFFREKGATPVENVISRSKYDALKSVRTKEKYVEEELANCQGLDIKKLAAKSRELADNYDKTELLKEIENKLYQVTLDPGDTYEKIKLHWEHRNHCHFSVV